MKNQDHQERGCECQEKSLRNCASLFGRLCTNFTFQALWIQKTQLACHKQANIHWSYFQRLDQPQRGGGGGTRYPFLLLFHIEDNKGGTRYPFLLLFHIEDNAYFKFGNIVRINDYVSKSSRVWSARFWFLDDEKDLSLSACSRSS